MTGPTHEDVRAANLKVYREIGYDHYEENPSIFESGRQGAIRKTLEEIAPAGGQGAILDIGTGTGNVLKLSEGLFTTRAGMDLSEVLLAELNRRSEGLALASGEGDHLPFPENTFDVVSSYGVLHHLVDPRGLLREASRVLKPGGVLYTDHDPNWYLGRFYRFLYNLRFKGRHGFGSEEMDLSEYHHTHTGGLNADHFVTYLKQHGMGEVDVHYRMTTSPGLPMLYKLIRFGLQVGTLILPIKSFYTHFYLIARKA